MGVRQAVIQSRTAFAKHLSASGLKSLNTSSARPLPQADVTSGTAAVAAVAAVVAVVAAAGER